MASLLDCYDPGLKLADAAEELRKLPDWTDPSTNARVMQFSLRWLIEYLDVRDGPPETVFRRLQELIERKKREIARIDPVFGRMDRDTDAFGVQCLADVHGTAALVREIVFQKLKNPRDPDRHASVDLGTGTGVLLGASMVRGLRQGASEVTGYGFDSQTRSCIRAQQMLDRIPGTSAEVFQSDVTQDETYEMFRTFDNVRGGMGDATHSQKGEPVDAWVSETVSTGTPPIAVNAKKNRVLVANNPIFAILNGGVDPYPAVIGKLSTIKGALKDIAEGRATLFPDVVSLDYVPDGEQGLIKLRAMASNAYVRLRNVGDDLHEQFRGSFGERRWG